MKLAGLLMFINDVHSLGLKATQGMYLTDSWYWNRDAETAPGAASSSRRSSACPRRCRRPTTPRRCST
jgi:hypothetical protein